MSSQVRTLTTNLGAAVFLVLFFGFFPIWAADYPERPISFLVGYAPGGPSDIQARALAAAAEPILGQPLLVLNRPGAGGTVMMATLATVKPDGYTIGITPGSLTVVPYFQQVNYDLSKDFTYLAALSTYTESFSVRADSPWKTLNDLIEYARKNPNQVNIGTAGVAVSPSIMEKVIARKAGVQWGEVPFKGDGDIVTALLGGHVHVGANSGSHIPQVRAGKLRLLFNATAERVREFPEVPTLRELGFDFIALSYSGVAGPKGLAQPIARKLEEAFRKARNDPVYLETLKKLSLFPMNEVGKEFEVRIVEMYGTVGKYLKK